MTAPVAHRVMREVGASRLTAAAIGIVEHGLAQARLQQQVGPVAAAGVQRSPDHAGPTGQNGVAADHVALQVLTWGPGSPSGSAGSAV
ncbi:hypothetical protein, partial [Aquabacterium sp.]|uniref:hypothetical protein n=1 Tax=Aquabacterium sp. TaxID=1872578 RepID=UPI0025C6E8DB